ncbi:MAG: hypothetical protein KIS76_03175 [Pyrinomonadaceae bacterium]|nr:hypothetical protein [Pyrinomonadaceae bacterium]
MNKSFSINRNSERGGAGIKLLLALVVFILIGNAGYNFVPVAYQGESFKQDIDGAIVKGTVLPTSGKAPIDVVKKNLFQAAKVNNIPDDAVLEVTMKDKAITGHVSYTKDVELLPFGLWVYKYEFEYSSAPATFLVKNS